MTLDNIFSTIDMTAFLTTQLQVAVEQENYETAAQINSHLTPKSN